MPKPILSNRFDCPYKPARCAKWEGWRFAKGKQHMDGRRALVYSRIRDESARPVGHGHHARQPAADRRRCRRATRSRASARSSACRSWETRLAAPLATDLSAWELAQLGWVRFRSSSVAALSTRRRAELERRRRVRAPRLRGQRRGDLDVARTLGSPAAPEGDALRRRLHPPLASSSPTPASASRRSPASPPACPTTSPLEETRRPCAFDLREP